MAQRPSTPVKVPSAAPNYTPATLDPDLRSQINTVLLRDGHVTKIQEALLHALNANPSNWPTMIQAHALSLLRSGDITTFPALLKRVLEDIRQDSSSSSSFSSSSTSTTSANGKASTTAATSITAAAAATSAINGDAKKPNGATPAQTPPTPAAAAASEKPNLAVPVSVIEEALRTTRECLEAVCEIEEKGSG